MPGSFLPVTPEEVAQRGWDAPDFVYAVGEAYVDHPSFGHAIIGRVLEALDSMSPAGYYAQMAIAWAVSIAYVKFPEETGSYLRRCRLDDFTYNKALQKAVESRRVSDEDKVRLRAMKRKG